MYTTDNNILIIEDTSGNIFKIEKPYTGFCDVYGKKIYLGDTLETLDKNYQNKITFDEVFNWGEDLLNYDSGKQLRKIK